MVALRLNTQSPIVVLHGYEIYEHGRLGPLSLAVCEAGLRMLEVVPDCRLILLGGWHLKEAGADITIADAMQQWLMERGAAEDRIITRKSLGLLHLMPPRDTHEEAALLKTMLNLLSMNGMDPFQFIAWEWHEQRIQWIYRTWKLRKAECIPVRPAFTGFWKRLAIEACAHVVQLFDPYGFGTICKKTREKRTLAHEGQPLMA